ncbi:MAG: RNA polymerase sigma factor RpoD, partial [uncultured Solirubrobacteraceae bacterium]
EREDRSAVGRRSTHFRAGGAEAAHRRRSGEGRPDVRADLDCARGGGGQQGAAPGVARVLRRARHRRGGRQRQTRHEREREGRERRAGTPPAPGGWPEEARDRPDRRAVAGLPAALPAVDRPRLVADRRAGGQPRQAHRARRHGGQAADGRGQPAPRRLDRQGLSRPRADVPGSHPGGFARPDPRGGEVRLPPRLQVLHLRDVVDPPGRDPGDRRQGPHDPHPGAHGRKAQQGRARRASARAVAGPGAHARGDRLRARGHRARGARHPPDEPAAHLPGEAHRGGGGVRARRLRRGSERDLAVRHGVGQPPQGERASRTGRVAPTRARGHRDALRPDGRAPAHARGGRPRVQRDPRANPSDREPHAEEARIAAGGPAAQGRLV